MILLALVSVVTVLSGCKPDQRFDHSTSTAGARTYVQFITTVLGCSIYKVVVEGPTSDLFITVCDDSTKASAVSYMSGKTPVHVVSGNTPSPTSTVVPTTVDTSLDFSTEEKKVLDQADQIRHKFEILDRLSTEDKATLGFAVKK
jgi:hypothetical protein